MIIFEENFFELPLCLSVAKTVQNEKSRYYYREWIHTLWYNIYQSLQEVGIQDCFENYKEKREKINQYMWDTFWDIYQILLQKMSNLLWVKCKYCDELILPWFQIITSDFPWSRIWQYDDEKTLFNWNKIFSWERSMEDWLEDSITFTIMIECPQESSYDYFPQTYSQYTKNREQKVCTSHVHLTWDICPDGDCLLKNSYETIQYKTGSLLLTKNRYLHRVGKSYFSNRGSYRITFQWHGILYNNILYLYW